MSLNYKTLVVILSFAKNLFVYGYCNEILRSVQDDESGF